MATTSVFLAFLVMATVTHGFVINTTTTASPTNTQTENFNFAVDPDTTIHSGLTDALYLTCTISKSAEATSDVTLLIKRQKGNSESEFTNIASINAFTKSVTIHEAGWEAEGQLTQMESHLTINWNHPSAKQAGEYFCDAILFDLSTPGKTMIQSRNQTIVHSIPSLEDIAGVIGEIKDELKSIQKRLDKQESVDSDTNNKLKAMQSNVDALRRRYY